MATPIGLVARRFERFEKAQRETNERLGNVEGALGSAVAILEAHSRQFERLEDAILGLSETVLGVSQRIDRLTHAIARGRTQDLLRLDDHEKRLRALEAKGRRRRKRG